MKFYLDFQSGSSPGLDIVGATEDLRELSLRLGKAASELDARGKKEGRLEIGSVDAVCDHIDWIGFRAVKEVATLEEQTRKRNRRRLIAMPLFWVLGIALLYLAYRGIRTF